MEDLTKFKATIEEREEYESHIEQGNIVYAGVDYQAILQECEKEADFILWDGGNNDASFFEPKLNIVVADALRPGHEMMFYPGETNARMADLLLINKVNSAKEKQIKAIENNLRSMNPKAPIVRCNSILTAEVPGKDAKQAAAMIKGKKVLVIEDGPTMTHGGMSQGAAFYLAKQEGASAIIDPRPYAKGSLKEVFAKFPQLQQVIPAMGYSPEQIHDLAETIAEASKHADLVLVGTPVNLASLFDIAKPVVRVRYNLEPIDPKPIEDAIKKLFTA
jgi:predicted GTPase